jgi:hypothetical protein
MRAIEMNDYRGTICRSEYVLHRGIAPISEVAGDL